MGRNRKRNSDGTYRKGRKGGANSPMVLTDKSPRARWVENETLYLQKIGLSFDNIAQILRAAWTCRVSARSRAPIFSTSAIWKEGNPDIFGSVL